MARTNPGLTDEQVATLRAAVAGPRKPRVSLLDTQFGAEATGQVVAIGDPATDGDDFITVRVKLGGVTDTLTFGPAELAIPTRARARTTTPKSAAKKPAAAKPAVAKPAVAKPLAATPSATKPSAAEPPAAAAEPVRQPAPAPSPASPSAPASQEPTRSRRPTAGRRRSPAPVTLTVSSAGNSWKVTAMRSGRSLVRATPLAPGVVTAVADLLGDQALQHAVAEINDVSLTEAEERARQLRDELAEVESLLKSHQRPGTKRGR